MKRSAAKGETLKTESAKKRKKKSNTATATATAPRNLIDNESLERVATPLGDVQTLAVSALDKQIILDRLKKEIVDAFGFSMSPSLSRKRRRMGKDRTFNSSVPKPYDEDDDDDYELVRIAQSRIVIGTNSCTKLMNKLFASKREKREKEDKDKDKEEPKPRTNIHIDTKTPSLCILCRDIRPPTILAHVPFLCQQLNIPILLLPGRASFDLGRALGGKTASVVLFLEGDAGPASTTKERRRHNQINSYIDFAKGKLPHGENKLC